MDKNKSPQDFLNEIFEQSQQSIPSPAPLPERGRHAYLLLYLIILLAGAFLVLLVCALWWRGTAAQVEPLEEELAALQSEKKQLEKQLEEAQERSAWLEEQTKQVQGEYTRLVSRCDQANLLDCLEQAVEAGDYLIAAVMIQDIDVIFNRHALSFGNKYLFPAQERQYLALRDTVFHNGVIILSRTATTEGVEAYSQGEEDWGGHYVERVDLAEEQFDQAELDTAWYLYGIFRDYPINPEYAAQTIVAEFQPNSDGTKILNSGAFQPATVERFEKIKADFLERDLLTETHGELRTVYVYGDVYYGTPDIIIDKFE